MSDPPPITSEELERRLKSVAADVRAAEEKLKLSRRELTALQGQVEALRRRNAA